LEDDREKALRLAALSDLDLPALLAAYWKMTPDVPQNLAKQYIASALRGVERGHRLLDSLENGGQRTSLLDVGCGTGGLIEAALQRGLQATGVDIALRWLIIARRRLHEAGLTATLVAADGGLLPFPTHHFEFATCVETLEHAEDPRGVFHGTLRCVRPGGVTCTITANRYGLAPEPTVRLWAVGALPRRYAAGYVRLRRGTSYQNFRALSRAEIRAIAGPRSEISITAAALPPPAPHSSKLVLALHSLYGWARTRKALQGLLVRIAPYLEVRATA
jgi:ubiquinone/menaquinone biosynthesis C-methylase UbiE